MMYVDCTRGLADLETVNTKVTVKDTETEKLRGEVWAAVVCVWLVFCMWSE